MAAHRWTRLTKDGIAVEGPCILYGVVALATVAGHAATLYDGLDTGSGRPLITVYVLANLSWGLVFGDGLELSSGIYLDLSANASEVTVIYESLEK